MFYRHLKTGNVYEKLHEGTHEATMLPVVIYRALRDNTIWVRPRDEFYDGRFLDVTSLPPSLRPAPNISLHVMTDEEVQDELGYWSQKIKDAPGPASSGAAFEFYQDCRRELQRRTRLRGLSTPNKGSGRESHGDGQGSGEERHDHGAVPSGEVK